ncbi:MAG: DUF1499 domain-containing protein [Rubrobacter sp.]|nr:DUF1499 domain-containing protein [Rubrobacter sp.]MDQ3378380.1 DUF1499 domain-containing protein [Actinomycetota bacterium]
MPKLVYERRISFCSLLFAISLLAGCGGTPPKDLGVEDEQLKPCPSTPNCVSTRADANVRHRMEPIAYSGNSEEAMETIATAVEGSERAGITHRGDGYLRAAFTSRVFRFVDDVEFTLDEKEKLVHFRSASRLGSSDMGVNRDRMTALSKELKPKLGD